LLIALNGLLAGLCQAFAPFPGDMIPLNAPRRPGPAVPGGAIAKHVGDLPKRNVRIV